MIEFFAVGPRAAGAGGYSMAGEILAEEHGSAFRNGRISRFRLYSAHSGNHHPWALRHGDDRIRQVSLALAKTPVSFLEGCYGHRSSLLVRRGESCAIWALKVGVESEMAENRGRLHP